MSVPIRIDLDDASGVYMLFADLFICVSFVLLLIVGGGGHPAVLELSSEASSDTTDVESAQVIYLNANDGQLELRFDDARGKLVELDDIGRHLSSNKPLVFVHDPDMPAAHIYTVQRHIDGTGIEASFGLASTTTKR